MEDYAKSIEAIRPEEMHEQIAADSKDTTIIIDEGRYKEVIPRVLQIKANKIDAAEHINILLPYVNLYKFINKSIVFKNKYDSILTEIRSTNR